MKKIVDLRRTGGTAVKKLVFLVMLFMMSCGGEECYYDEECLSESCTYGTCDPGWADLILDLIELFSEAEDDSSYMGNSKDEDEPAACHAYRGCDWFFDVNECRIQPGCTSEGLCFVEDLYNSTSEQMDYCQKLAYEDCSDICSFTFYRCVSSKPDCAGKSETECHRIPGCVYSS